MIGTNTKSVDAMHENNKQKEILCGQCGYKHRPKECPAFGQQCSLCHKLHHFAKLCHNKRLTAASKNRQTNTNASKSTEKRVYSLDQEDNISVAEK